jgi:hypothetical protein
MLGLGALAALLVAAFSVNARGIAAVQATRTIAAHGADETYTTVCPTTTTLPARRAADASTTTTATSWACPMPPAPSGYNYIYGQCGGEGYDGAPPRSLLAGGSVW